MRAAVKQRADLTHKHNRTNGRHGWLRLTPAYSVKLVSDILDNHTGLLRVIEPFSGTGTTPLAAVCRGHEAVAFDINPFLIWLGRAKLRSYSPKTLADARSIAVKIADPKYRGTVTPADAPPLHNIERWWSGTDLLFLRQIKAGILAETKGNSPLQDLLQIAFCRTLIDLSNAAFNHQSMSFTDKARNKNGNGQMSLFSEPPPHQVFLKDAEFVIASAADNPNGKGTVINSDARTLTNDDGEFDLLITSPPYPNRMSYIRELRPYMYWLDYLTDARQAAELDWQAIGGTWGTATSRLGQWEPDEKAFLPDYLKGAIREVARPENTSGDLLSVYIRKYFTDMWYHFQHVYRLMRRGGEVNYIIGNSTFYGVMIAAEHVYADMLTEVGFGNVQIRTIRKRNSKKELFEFNVTGEVP